MKAFIWLALISVFAAIGMLLVGACDDDDDDNDDDNDDNDTTDDDTTDDDNDDVDDDNDADDDDDNDDVTTLFDIDFENYSPGALPAPWDVVEVNGQAVVVADPTGGGYGNLLEISGDIGDGSYVGAFYPFTASADNVEVSFYLYNNGGAALGFQVDSTSIDWIVQLVNNPTTYEVTLYDGGGTACATIIPAGWYKFNLIFDFAGMTVDFQINDADTACVGLGIDADDIEGFTVRDFPDDGYGGIVYYDNFLGVEY
jgi:hypothetical protein